MLAGMKFKVDTTAFAMLSVTYLAGCGSPTSSTPPPPPIISITATGGSGQSTVVGSPFSQQLEAEVTSNGAPASGIVVTFTAPTSGASSTFPGGVNTVTTNATGVASVALAANGVAGAYTVTAKAAGASTPASFGLTNTAGPAASIAATGGASQNAAIGATFASLSATVADSYQNPVEGVMVTFTAPTSGPSGTFVGGASTAAAETNTAGIALTTFTANETIGGPYLITASAAGLATSTAFSLTNRASTSTYCFYLSGLQINTVPDESHPNFYTLAESVTIDASGNVVAGEQDFNNAVGTTSPQPSGDTITGGMFTWVDAAVGQGTLTLNTNNHSLGANGVETLGIQFVNPNHAMIIQFDGTATSSGSMDLQALPSILDGGYAFTLSVINPAHYTTIVTGGVFSISGETLRNGIIDTNNAGSVTSGAALTGAISAPDGFGRGTITNTGIAAVLNYYIVNPEAIRIIDVDPTDSGIGSAFGQGSSLGTFSNSSLGASVFVVDGNPEAYNAAIGMFSTAPSGGTVQGVGDLFGSGGFSPGTPISGTYSIAQNGYGSLAITPGSLGNFSALGIYLTDPRLNIVDPNNASTGLGGALVADLDSSAYGTGVLIPQTDTSSSSFTGNYTFGTQAYDTDVAGWEFDFIGQGSVASTAFTGTALLSDPFKFLSANLTDSGASISGKAVVDPQNPGRYMMWSGGPFTISTAGGYLTFQVPVVVYQATGSLLFWMDEDTLSLFFGHLEAAGPLIVIGSPATAKARATHGR